LKQGDGIQLQVETVVAVLLLIGGGDGKESFGLVNLLLVLIISRKKKMMPKIFSNFLKISTHYFFLPFLD
jgi:hypothetical protein